MLDHLSPQRRRFVIGVGAVIAAVVLAVIVALVVRRLSGPAPVPQDRPGPVLLVPGYGGTGESLEPLADQIGRTGRSVTIVAPVGDGTGDLRVQAAHLAEVADQIRTAAAAPSVDVVGYSAGGVVARLWVRDFGGAGVARRVLSLGAPQHGSTQAQLGRDLAGGCPPACEQLVPGGELLRELNAGDETPAGPTWITLRSATDQVVSPTDSAALTGALNLIVQDACPDRPVGHAQLTSHPYTYATVEAVFGPGDPQTPSAVC